MDFQCDSIMSDNDIICVAISRLKSISDLHSFKAKRNRIESVINLLEELSNRYDDFDFSDSYIDLDIKDLFPEE